MYCKPSFGNSSLYLLCTVNGLLLAICLQKELFERKGQRITHVAMHVALHARGKSGNHFFRNVLSPALFCTAETFIGLCADRNRIFDESFASFLPMNRRIPSVSFVGSGITR